MTEHKCFVFSFADVEVREREFCIVKAGELLRVEPKAFRVLLFLIRSPHRLITKDELLDAVWSDCAVSDNSLTRCVALLRRSLGDDTREPRFIATVPTVGYRFLCDVKVVEDGFAGPNGAGLPQPQDSNDFAALPGRSGVEATPPTAGETPKRWKVIVPIAAAVLAFLVAGYFYFHRRPKLTDKDTIVLADFTNTTGDAVFDDTLKTALEVSLRQSPFLNVLSDRGVTKTLQQMTRPPSTKLTPDVARELCLRAGSKAYLAGSIGSLGSEYVLGLKAVNCQSGDTLAEEQMTAGSKEKVLDALGDAASKLRGELGESLATVQKFDVPLEQATTSSLEALKAYSLGLKVNTEKGSAVALPYYQRAIELDPNFAMGYALVGDAYIILNEPGRAREYFTKAFQLREHASELEKLFLTSDYYFLVTGELDKAAQARQELIESYPRDWRGYNGFGVVLWSQGQYEKSAEMVKQGLRLAPDLVFGYQVLAIDAFALQHFDEARQLIHEAQARSWMRSLCTRFSTLLRFTGRTLRPWWNSNSGLRVRPNWRILDWRSRPRRRRMAVILPKLGN